jgi:hypothetical protein
VIESAGVGRDEPGLGAMSGCRFDYWHREVWPARAHDRAQVTVHGLDQLLQVNSPVGRQIRPKVVGAAPPFVESASPVSPRVMKAARGDLDQSLVEARVGPFAVWHPIALPGLVRFPVATKVKELDPFRESSRQVFMAR